MGLFTPHITFRSGNNSGFRLAQEQQPPGTLDRATDIVLLVHGFANSETDASERFSKFKELIGEPGRQVVGVFWPGSNWSGPAFYMTSIGRADESAVRLAGALRNAAVGRVRLRVCIVAHSMGCRLTLRLVQELWERGGPPGLIVEAAVLMAAAVPVGLLEPGGGLRSSLERTPRLNVLSLYSDNDWVLKVAFRAGQSAAGDGWFPVALGARKWNGAPGCVEQADAPGAGHGDYWFGQFPADEAGRHLGIGRAGAERASAVRGVPLRRIAERAMSDGQAVAAGHSVGVRDVPHRRPNRRV
jgi:pimeloyl-ACP methyl ester carboxylesterase